MSDQRTTTEELPRSIPRQTEGFDNEPPFGNEPAPVKAPGTALAESGLVGGADGTGTEGARASEMQTPGLRIVQSNSPQLIKNNAAYIEAARAGDIMNTATGETWDGERGIEIVVFARDYHYGIWVPRNPDGGGGGFRGIKLDNDPVVRRLLLEHGRFKKLPWELDGERVELVETGQLYVYYGDADGITADNARPAYVSMSSTNMPTYTRWFGRHMGWTYDQGNGRRGPAPLWAYIWRLTTRPQSRGTQNWYTFNVDLVQLGKPLESLTMLKDRALYGMADEMYKSWKAGLVTAVREEREPGEEDDIPPM